MAKYVTIQVARREPPPRSEAGGERCKRCSTALAEGELQQSLWVCPHCGYHYPMPAHERVALLADRGSATFIAEE
ncbi:MAG: acetyl-CoA carboxylase carboxyl transferase subunit beta, partial [Thermoleophilia bacterium]|nr:acetyl-CoA carboxylase carboxyl transferase subunit beta [Thermoleophilia bacterium]